jgi:3',5'-cyclic AMP phosphodiesterase CpdA
MTAGSVLLQVSDPHFGTEQPPVLEALLRLARAQQPDVLLLSGDITQRARPSQFDAARAFVDRLQVPVVLAIAGNHDIPLFNPLARLLWPYAGFKRVFGPELEPRFENAAVLVLSVKTTRRWRHSDGEVSSRQVERVAQALAGARPGQWRIVLVHQPVAVTREQDRHNLLHGRAHALRRWAEAGADLIVGGHIHLPFVLPLHALDPALARPMWAVQAGTALSHRVRADAGNSVNIIRLGPAVGLGAPRGPCRVERWDFQPASESFERARVHELGVIDGVD